MESQIGRALSGLPATALDGANDLGPCWYCGGRGIGGVLSTCVRLAKRGPHDSASPLEGWTMREYVVISRCADCLVWQRRAEHRVTVVQAIAVALAAALVALLPVPPVARTLSFVVLGAAALLAGLALGGAWVERSFLHPQGRRSRAERLLHPRVRALTESGWTPFDVPRSVPGDTGTVLATANYLHTTTGDLGPLLAACAKARSLAPAEAALPIGDVSAGAA